MSKFFFTKFRVHYQKYEVTVKLQGGLGNQLFQYAFGRSLMNRGFCVNFDKSFFVSETVYTKRNFVLTEFKLNPCICIETSSVKKTFTQKVCARLDPDSGVRYVEKRLIKPARCESGYYNSEKYFFSIREDLLKEIVLKKKSLLYKKIQNMIEKTPNALIVHARRGDYLQSTGFTILDKRYYQKALTFFPKDVHIFAFSDDIEWLKEVLERDVYAVSGQGLEDFEELSLMAQGKNFIIANSTFSWWGAWLAQCKYKKVVAPKKWFRSIFWWRANKDVVPKSWIRI